MKVTVLVVVLGLAICPVAARADCLGIAKGAVSQCLADTGDGKVAALWVQNRKCIRDRVSDISHAWRHFNKAVESLDTDRIKAEAANVRYQTQGRSKMYTSCWNTMKNSCKLVGGAVDKAINALSAGTCH